MDPRNKFQHAEAEFEPDVTNPKNVKAGITTRITRSVSHGLEEKKIYLENGVFL